jgi:archaellum component FlaC
MTELTREHFDEAIGQISGRLDKGDERFEGLLGTISKSFQSIEERFDQVDNRFDSIEGELKAIHGRLDSQASDLTLLQKDVREIKERLEENMLPRIANLEARVD